MSKKNKGRGQKMSLADFGGNDDTKNLDWAQDELAPTPPTGPAAAGDMPPGMGKGPKKDWRDFGFKAGSIDGNFRDQAPMQNTNIVPVDMQAPYVAYVGNLPHNIEPATVEDNFVEVNDVRVVRHDRSTFAYVEFDSRDALQNAILTTGKNVGGRKIKVDVATPQQISRLENERKGGNSGRESAASNAFSGGRDGMGATQPSAPGMGGMGGRSGSRMGSRNASNMDLAFSRDGMGRGGDPMSPSSPTPEFSRDVFGAVQPPPRTPNSTGGRGGGGGGFRDRSSKPASPVAGGMPDFGNFRDGDRAEQPAAASPVDRGAPTFARRKEGKVTPEDKPAAGGSGWRDAPATKAPASNPWRTGPPADN